MPEDAERTQLEANAKLTENSLALEAQVEARPLAKKQEELQGTPATESSSNPDETPAKKDDQPPTATKEKEEAKSTTPTKTPRKALLRNDDVELDRVYKVCVSENGQTREALTFQ